MMQGKHPNSARAAAHNFALRQVSGAIASIRGQLAQCKSLTPEARLRLKKARAELLAAEAEIRNRRINADGSIWERPECK